MEVIECIAEVRLGLYTASTEKLQAILVTIAPGFDSKDVGRPKLLSVVETYLTKLEKEEDGGLEKLKALGAELGVKRPVPSSTTGKDTRDDIPSVYNYKKDFKINGSVGDSRTQVPFSSITRQMQIGLDKGYREAEIIEGVISCIQPGVTLRSYLEGRNDLTLNIVKKVLQSHYKEPTVTDLYKQLCNVTQRAGENAMEFVTRSLDLKQKVIIASQGDTDFPYDPNLVHRMFLHSVETGLRDETIIQQLRSLLTPATSDLDILQGLNKILLVESEHSSKVKKVNTIEVDAELKSLRNDMDSLRLNMMNTQPGDGEPRGSDGNQSGKRQFKKPAKRRCDNCEATNSTECQHCFKCGSDTHFSRGCRVSLNAQRSLHLGNQ